MASAGRPPELLFMTPQPPKSIVVIEDHPLYGQALRALLEKEFPAQQVFTEPNLSAGCQTIEQENRSGNRPVVLLDLGLPDVSGINAAMAVAKQFPSNPLGIISASEDPVQINTCLSAGARMFISKQASPHALAQSVRDLLADDTSEPKWIDSEGVKNFDRHQSIRLTDRQLEVLRLICRGKSNKDIADELGMAEMTTKAHVSAIFKELRVVNRTQAVLTAQRVGLSQTS